MFERLPETFPERDGRKKPALFSSAALHLLAVLLLLSIPLWTPYAPIRPQFITRLYMFPPPPEPASTAPVGRVRAEAAPVIRKQTAVVHEEVQPQPAKPEQERIAPEAIPGDIAALENLQPVQPEGWVGGAPGGVPAGVPEGIPGLSAASQSPLLPPPQRAPNFTAPDKPLPVGGDVKAPRLVKYVAPKYPLLAKKEEIQGAVVVEATVTKAGTVTNVELVSGNPMLADAAIDAVRQWRYAPTRLNGAPVSVILTAKVNFSLGGAS